MAHNPGMQRAIKLRNWTTTGSSLIWSLDDLGREIYAMFRGNVSIYLLISKHKLSITGLSHKRLLSTVGRYSTLIRRASRYYFLQYGVE